MDFIWNYFNIENGLFGIFIYYGILIRIFMISWIFFRD
jgi:hypothetical protein